MLSHMDAQSLSRASVTERLSLLICCIFTCSMENLCGILLTWTYHMHLDKQDLRIIIIRKFLYVHNSRTFTLLYIIRSCRIKLKFFYWYRIAFCVQFIYLKVHVCDYTQVYMFFTSLPHKIKLFKRRLQHFSLAT